MIGRTLSHYEIQEELSRGGMGVVYRALDTKLDRDVALKVLPPELTADETRLRRFIQEAKVAASIHHPHVATIHEIDEEDGVHFIVMELIEGEKLSALLARGPLPAPRALELATEVAEGLSKAHEKGIVHRDLKPANLMVTADGHIKIIDFGLAKLVEHLDRVDSDVETGFRGETDPGQVLGTVSYMSPEQARGETVDHRSDLFSFGIVLYEILVGTVPFRGKSATDTLSAILRDPAPRLSRVESAPELQHVLDRCLAKRVDERYQSANDLLAELKRLKRDSESGARAPAAPTPRWSPMWLIAPLVLVAGLVFWWVRSSDRYEPRIGRTIQITNAPGPELDPAISPDGAFVAYAAGPLGDTKIYVQQVAGGRPVALTEDLSGAHRLPRWSPDGTRILFRRSEERSLFGHYSVPALGGAPLRFPWKGRDAAWSPDGERIAYAAAEGIFVTLSGGGDGVQVTDARVHKNLDETPSTVAWSPDGTRLAFTTGNPAYIDILNIAQSDLWVTPSSGGEATRITEDVFLDFGPVFTPDGKGLLFVSDRGGGRDIYHVDLDEPGQPTRLTTGLGAHLISLSRDGGKLAYSVLTVRQNLWSIPIPKGEAVSVGDARPVTTGNQAIEGVDVSPDGKWLVFDSNRSGNLDIYKMPVSGGELVRLTTHPAMDCCPTWSPDGREIAFHSLRAGNRDIFVVSADGGGEPVPITSDPGQERYPHWSPDGREIAFQSDRSGVNQIYVLSRERGEVAGESPRQVAFADEGLRLPRWSGLPRWSPKGNGIAYGANSGVFLVPASGGSPRLLAPIGIAPLWSPDGETVYLHHSDGIWSVPASGGEPRLLVRFDDPSRLRLRSEGSTDGESFYFALTEYESDVFVMELEER